MIDRRSFLLGASALPLALGHGRGVCVPRGDDRALIVVELAGGNDGLATVIPVDDPRYAALRPNLQVVRHGARPLGDGTSLHGALEKLHRRCGAGQVAVVHGVGHANPDRSHFRSRDIWHTADPSHVRVQHGTTGWLGRAADRLAADSSGMPAAAIGALEVPLVLRAARATVPSLRRIEDFLWLGAAASGPLAADDATRQVVSRAAVGNGDDARAHAAATAKVAIRLADDLGVALARYRARAEYPDTELGRDLQLAARVAIAGFGTRLLHLSFGGFDTHARQVPTHRSLLSQLDEALDAVCADLDGHGRSSRTMLVVHSEFGRRAAENASQGTDHGAAAPVFVALGDIVGGPHGTPPDLQKLVDGDVAATCDFRSVYGDVLQWMGIDATAVLGASFENSGVIAR